MATTGQPVGQLSWDDVQTRIGQRRRFAPVAPNAPATPLQEGPLRPNGKPGTSRGPFAAEGREQVFPSTRQELMATVPAGPTVRRPTRRLAAVRTAFRAGTIRRPPAWRTASRSPPVRLDPLRNQLGGRPDRGQWRAVRPRSFICRSWAASSPLPGSLGDLTWKPVR